MSTTTTTMEVRACLGCDEPWVFPESPSAAFGGEYPPRLLCDACMEWIGKDEAQPTADEGHA